ncbi:MAG: GGDEF domain-containing protein, partial [Rhodobacterales bacterium]|nr:GGDEF domain-containing protein [Rhodobacterales bacterium]
FAADWDAWTWLPQPALIAFALSGLALLALAGWRRTPVDLALPAVLAAGALALHAVGRGGLPALFFTAAALAPLAALLMDAWRMAFIDDLTGLPGRRALNQSLRGLGRRYAIAMVDIDHFKAFNDTHGHDVGDQVLRMVAARLSRVGGGGRAHRYGGEEFAILFPGRTVDQTRPVLEALRAAMADEPFRLRGPTRRRPEDEEAGRRRRGSGAESPGVRVTVSIGVAERTGDKPTPQAVIQAADRALYQAKRVGRNRVVADRAGLEGVLSPAA